MRSFIMLLGITTRAGIPWASELAYRRLLRPRQIGCGSLLELAGPLPRPRCALVRHSILRLV